MQKIHDKLSGNTEFPRTPCSLTHTASPLSPPHAQAVHLLQLMNLRWHVIITQSLWFTLGFTLNDDVYGF